MDQVVGLFVRDPASELDEFEVVGVEVLLFEFHGRHRRGWRLGEEEEIGRTLSPSLAGRTVTE